MELVLALVLEMQMNCGGRASSFGGDGLVVEVGLVVMVVISAMYLDYMMTLMLTSATRVQQYILKSGR